MNLIFLNCQVEIMNYLSPKVVARGKEEIQCTLSTEHPLMATLGSSPARGPHSSRFKAPAVGGLGGTPIQGANPPFLEALHIAG